MIIHPNIHIVAILQSIDSFVVNLDLSQKQGSTSYIVFSVTMTVRKALINNQD